MNTNTPSLPPIPPIQVITEGGELPLMDFNTLTNYNCDAAHLISLFIERRVRHDFINVYILRQNRILYILRQNRIVECASIEMEKSHLFLRGQLLTYIKLKASNSSQTELLVMILLDHRCATISVNHFCTGPSLVPET